MTSDKVENIHPLWSPDSRYLGYLSQGQIVIKAREGYSGFQVTDAQEGINDFKWSPDGKGIYFIKSLPEEQVLKERREIYG